MAWVSQALEEPALTWTGRIAFQEDLLRVVNLGTAKKAHSEREWARQRACTFGTEGWVPRTKHCGIQTKRIELKFRTKEPEERASDSCQRNADKAWSVSKRAASTSRWASRPALGCQRAAWISATKIQLWQATMGRFSNPVQRSRQLDSWIIWLASAGTWRGPPYCPGGTGSSHYWTYWDQRAFSL